MKKMYFLLVLLLLPLMAGGITPPDRAFKVSFVTIYRGEGTPPYIGSIPFPRTPAATPDIYYYGHNVYICTIYTEDIELQLLDPDTVDDDEPTVLYTTDVRAGIQIVSLPTSYTGDYAIRLVVGNWYHTGEITL